MAQLIVKSGVKQLSLFENQDFPYFEAYLKGDETEEELIQLVHHKMKLISLHLPSNVQDNVGNFCPLNFGDSGKSSEVSYQALKKYIKFANNHNITYLVIHLGYYNCLKENRFTILDRIAQTFNHLETGKVKLCLENVPCWINLCLETEPLITTELHWLYFKQKCPKIGLVLDLDHI